MATVSIMTNRIVLVKRAHNSSRGYETRSLVACGVGEGWVIEACNVCMKTIFTFYNRKKSVLAVCLSLKSCNAAVYKLSGASEIYSFSVTLKKTLLT